MVVGKVDGVCGHSLGKKTEDPARKKRLGNDLKDAVQIDKRTESV